MKNLYKQLKEITQEKEGVFYSSTQEIDGYFIESFSYRLAGWNEFNENPIKKEMRGIAFIYGKEIKEPQLFTLGFHKFFNYGEGIGENSTINLLKNNKIESITDKLDGSLIMVGKLPSGKIIAKSKTSIISEQAVKATNIISKDEELQKFINTLLKDNLFPIFEYIGPDNRIVVSYNSSKLILLGIRDVNGNYLTHKKVLTITKDFNNIEIVEEKKLSFEEIMIKKETEKGYEGFIVSLSNGEKIKVKLDSYILLHHTKDEINNIKKLIQSALNEDLDDLRSLFCEDINVLKRIDLVEKKVFDYTSHIKNKVELEFDKTKGFDRKEFAIYHQKENKDIFSLLMDRYIINNAGEEKNGKKREIDYKTFVLKNIKLEEEDLLI